MQGIKIKPLVWVKHPSKDIWRSDQPFGTYKVFGVGPTPSWDFDSLSDGKDKISKTADSVDAAKAAAQADYEGHILAALEPAPVTPAEAVKGPTDNQVASACMSYRHDFGLLPARDREALMFQAREWLRAWQKELPTALRAIGRDEA